MLFYVLQEYYLIGKHMFSSIYNRKQFQSPNLIVTIVAHHASKLRVPAVFLLLSVGN